jgi:hypothetical protein
MSSMFNAMFNIWEKTAANKGKQEIAARSIFPEFLATAANTRKQIFDPFTAETRVRFP